MPPNVASMAESQSGTDHDIARDACECHTCDPSRIFW